MKKKLMITLVVVLLLALTVGGTLAYFTDADTAVNTITVGRVGISLTEEGATLVNGVLGQQYHLLPGHSYDKEPTITVDADSMDCYLFVKVENGIEAIETQTAADTIAAQLETNGWILLEGSVYYNTEVASAGDELVVFESFTIDGSTTNAELAAHKDASITITAYAIQQAGFDTAADAWEAAALS